MDHRLVVDREQLLANTFGHWPQPASRAPGQDDAFHRKTIEDTRYPIGESGTADYRLTLQALAQAFSESCTLRHGYVNAIAVRKLTISESAA